MELFLLWFVLTAYFIWRLYTVTKKRTVINQELSGTVFMLALGVLGLADRLLPVRPSRGVAVAVLAVLLVITVVISYKLNKKYEAWRREMEEKGL